MSEQLIRSFLKLIKLKRVHMKHLLFILISSILFVSCTQQNKGIQSSNINSGNVWHEPIKADLVVDQQKVTGKSTSTYFLFFRVNGDKNYLDNVEYSVNSSVNVNDVFSFLNPFKLLERIFTGDEKNKIKAAAAYNAIENLPGVDVLVHPTWKVSQRNFLIFYQFKAEVEGYVGTYSNFRNERYEEQMLEHQINKAIADKVKFELDAEDLKY
jgi:hypothetical protein